MSNATPAHRGRTAESSRKTTSAISALSVVSKDRGLRHLCDRTNRVLCFPQTSFPSVPVLSFHLCARKKANQRPPRPPRPYSHSISAPARKKNCALHLL